MNNLIVMKFGGTSVGTAERMRVAADICRTQAQLGPVALVVSAMSRITDLLLDTLRHAEAGDNGGVERNLTELEERHVGTCRELLPPELQTREMPAIRELIAAFRRIANGMLMLGERPPRSVDEAVTIGERLSITLLRAYMEASGTQAEAINAAEVIVTDAVFGSATPLMEKTREKLRARVIPLLVAGIVPIITGFNGATEDGQPTTLGRGGSDFSASIVAACLDAAELWIYTDVDGIMTADPRLVPDAQVLDELTFHEAAELAYAGAKVLHPRTLAPLEERQIPVWSKNSFDSAKPGTRIVPHTSVPRGGRAVTSTANVALISVESARTGVNPTQVMARALNALSHTNIEILAFSSSSYRQSFCFLVRQDELEEALRSLETFFAIERRHGYVKPFEVDRNVGLLAVVGEGMRGDRGLAGRIFTAISRENVNIIAIAQGSSELTIAIVVRREGLEKAVKAVHAECDMARKAHMAGHIEA